jgi:hypothetical protein
MQGLRNCSALILDGLLIDYFDTRQVLLRYRLHQLSTLPRECLK